MAARLPVLALTVAGVLVLPDHSTRAESHIYFPASVGYRWTYRTPPDVQTTWEFLSSEEVEGVEYMLYGPSIDLAERVRVDEDGRVWTWAETGEQMWLDPDGTLYDYTAPDGHLSHVVVTRSVTVDTPMGTFEGCIEFAFVAAGARLEGESRTRRHDDFRLTLAPGMGVVRRIDAGVRSLLVSTNVDPEVAVSWGGLKETYRD